VMTGRKLCRNLQWKRVDGQSEKATVLGFTRLYTWPWLDFSLLTLGHNINCLINSTVFSPPLVKCWNTSETTSLASLRTALSVFACPYIFKAQ
jgi:hypothetical protein